jgi:hypothetical protein
VWGCHSDGWGGVGGVGQAAGVQLIS